MESIFRSPLRVYLILALLSLIGIAAATQLPVSLFPNSSKPRVGISMSLDFAPDAFMRQYGSRFEDQLKSIHTSTLAVEKVTATYRSGNVQYEVEFEWGSPAEDAIREVQNIAYPFASGISERTRETTNVWTRGDNSGFLALSFYSSEKSLTEIYRAVEPILIPKLAHIANADGIELYNPQKKEVSVELKPESLAAFGLFPSDVASGILRSLEAYDGGSVKIADSQLRIEVPRAVNSFEELKLIQIPVKNGRTVSLGDIAHLDFAVPIDSARVFKTSGASSIILWASPKPGGNVKAMAEDVIAVVKETAPLLPKDIQYKTLVDPSEFIRSAVGNVAKEVALAAGLAVVILFLFVGNLRNVITAAIEIPLSIILAFILMRLSGMNLNLISLGGLALSAGMNVDASVVVMENIFRHFELEGSRQLDFEERVRIVCGAVREVRFAVIASTVASLVVFVPLAFTSQLTNAILGDLAKAVVFSHGFSAIVALILVPTIRLHLMTKGMPHEKPSVLEGVLRWLENAYARALGIFLSGNGLKFTAYALLTLLFAVLLTTVVPRLPREIIGKPDTDWVMIGFNTRGNTLTRQIEGQNEQFENELLKKFGGHSLYTFTQIFEANGAMTMLRLKDKREMTDIIKQMEEAFPNTPEISYWVESWNPAELRVPDPPDFKVSIRGNDIDQMALTARDISNSLKDQKIFTNVRVEPNANLEEAIRIRPRLEQLPLLQAQGTYLSLVQLADLSRTATEGRYVSKIGLKDENGGVDETTVTMRFPEGYITGPDELGALPIGVGSRIIPLKAFAAISREEVRPSILRENMREKFTVSARGERGELEKTKQSVKKAEALVKTMSGVELEDAKEELTSALKQLALAISLSILLIFVTMVFQFGSLMNSALVLVAIPLGFIGVLLALFVFKSTLSLNSMLGVILLNGIAVANSIILVDFLQEKVKEGVAPKLAAVEVARVRLRPILMTSLTTGLGMLPVAFGIGEGGKILQPLGIAVAGGLVFSTCTTLFIVPALQVAWLERVARQPHRRESSHA